MSSRKMEGPRPCCSPATTTDSTTNTTTDSTLADSSETFEVEDVDGENDPNTEINIETETETETNAEVDTATESSDFGSNKEEEGDSPVNLDRFLSGPCSICSSPDHDDEDCEKEPDPRYLMTTALPRPHASEDTSHLLFLSSSSFSCNGDQDGPGGSQNSNLE